MRQLRRAWRAPMLVHVLAYALVLLALVPFMRLDSSFSSDDGAYALQVHALEDGSWSWHYPFAELDPDNELFPYDNTRISDEGWFPYAKHPSYPLMLRQSTRLLGEVAGLRIVPMLGAVVLAASAWWLAGVLGTSRRLAFWLAALSPALVNAYNLWAHSWSAALGGMAVLGAALVIARGLTRAPAALMSVSLLLGVLLRAEALLLAGALAAILIVHEVRAGRIRTGMLAGVLALVPAAGASYLERLWVSEITGQAVAVEGLRQSGGSLFVGRMEGAFHVLLKGSYLEEDVGLLVTAGAPLVLFAALAARRRASDHWRRDALMASLLALALYGLRYVVDADETVTGLLAAWPVVVVGLVFVVRRRAPVLDRALLWVVALFSAAVLASQYSAGGGFEWGGRFFSPILAAIAVLATTGLVRMASSLGSRDRAVASALVASVALVPAALGISAVALTQRMHDRMIEEVEATGAEVAITPLLFLPRVAWRTDPGIDWLLVTGSETQGVVRELGQRDGRSVVIVGTRFDEPVEPVPGLPRREEVDAPSSESLGLRLELLRPSTPSGAES